MIKKLIWLIKNQEKIEKIIKEEKPKVENKDKNYSLDGVPDFQKDYIEDLLSGKLKK